MARMDTELMLKSMEASAHVPQRRGSIRLLLCKLCIVFLVGCSSKPDTTLRSMVDRGDHARAAERVSVRLASKRADRDYLLDRMRLGIALLADGRPEAAEPVMNRSFEILRTQGINDDKTVAAAVLGEGGVIWWKGEPFEQAMMFHYIAVQQALLGHWDNARAAAQSSLFLLKDFGENERGARKTTEEIGREAARRAERQGNPDAFDEYLDHGYTPAKTDFSLGYFMNGAANLALFRSGGDPSRRDEAEDNFREAAALKPDLRPVAQALMEGGANTLILVDFGPGPEKIRYGPDGSLARFSPRLASDARALAVHVDGAAAPAAQASDLNSMAADHMWNNFEQVRAAKSSLGTAMILGGAVAASSDNQTAQIVGLSLIGVGLLSKLTAGADTRYCEVLPQRVYVSAAAIRGHGSTIRLSIGGGPVIALPCIDPPSPAHGLRLVYFRMPRSDVASMWSSATLRYSNDSCAASVPGDELPFILGGRCVRRPSLSVLRQYQAAGNLLDYSINDLANLYREEGVRLDISPREAVGARHILEGGDTLESPIAGSAGFLRLFCTEHPPWVSRKRKR